MSGIESARNLLLAYDDELGNDEGVADYASHQSYIVPPPTGGSKEAFLDDWDPAPVGKIADASTIRGGAVILFDYSDSSDEDDEQKPPTRDGGQRDAAPEKTEPSSLSRVGELASDDEPTFETVEVPLVQGAAEGAVDDERPEVLEEPAVLEMFTSAGAEFDISDCRVSSDGGAPDGGIDISDCFARVAWSG